VNTLLEILRDHRDYRKQIIKLAKSDMVKTYKGAALGWAWAIIKPAITIFVFWFAFSIGLRHGQPVDGYPFFLWLIAGMIPWFYMRDMLQGGSGSLRRYSYLVTKIKFPVDTIPTFVSLSYFFVHLGLLLIMICIYTAFGFPPNIYYLQLPLFLFMMFMFFTAWGLFSSLLSAVSKDFMNMVKAVTQALFWLSGILYDADRIQVGWIRETLLFNPITLIANGYRNCFVYHRWFWETPGQMRNFIIVYVVMLAFAVWAYKKLRRDIPDVL